MGNKQTSDYVNDTIVLKEKPVRIQDQEIMQRVLNRSIGGLTFLTKIGPGAGSGVLISQNLLLTAAHNIYNRDQKCQNSELRFYPGANGETGNFYEAEGWRYPQKFKTCPSDKRLQYDFALVKLRPSQEHPIGYDQFPALQVVCEKCMISKNKQLSLGIYGYPNQQTYNFSAVDPMGIKIRLHQYGLQRCGRIVAVKAQQFEISYKISTLQGHSGSSISLGDNIVGVHNGGRDQKSFGKTQNVGRYVSFCFLEYLATWQTQLNGQAFRTNFQSLCHHLKRQKRIFPSKNPLKIPDAIKKILQNTKNSRKLEISSHGLRAVNMTKHKSNLQQLRWGEIKLSEYLDPKSNRYSCDYTLYAENRN